MKKILITGATGFVGKHLAPALTALGYDVFSTGRVKDISTPKVSSLLNLDITDTHQTFELIQTVKPNLIIHLAAQSSVGQSWLHPLPTFEVNLHGTLNLLEALRLSSPETKLLFASSVQVYGRSFNAGTPLDENSNAFPLNPYASSKKLAEEACQHYFNIYGIQSMITRNAYSVGVGQSEHLVFTDWCRQIAHIESGSIPAELRVGDLTVHRPFLPIEDVVDAYILLIEKGIPGQIYNIASTYSKPLSDFILYLKGISKAPFAVITDPLKIRKDDVSTIAIDTAKIRALGWNPNRDINDSLLKLMDHCRHQSSSPINSISSRAASK